MVLLVHSMNDPFHQVLQLQPLWPGEEWSVIVACTVAAVMVERSASVDWRFSLSTRRCVKVKAA